MRRCEIFPAPCIWANSEFLEVPYILLGSRLRGSCNRASPCIIADFPAYEIIMEAEQLNALTRHLQDLQVRNLELRRYL